MFLDRLPPDERQPLLGQMRRVRLERSRVLYERDDPITFVYFPISSLLSLAALTRDGSEIETNLIGRDGFLGVSLYFGSASTPLRARCLIEGDAWGIRADALRQAATPDTALFTLLRDYAHASFIEIAQLAACYRVHTPVQRCARWLCMVQDRLGRGDFFITQETLASRLGIRRSTITRAMGVLQDRGAVRYRRGEFAVADRQALEALSCECYAIIKRYHHRIMAL